MVSSRAMTSRDLPPPEAAARPARWLALLVAFMLFPGASEALTDLGHLLVDGHTAHAPCEADDDHGAQDEHGCSGLFHTCRCCPAPVVLAAIALDHARRPDAERSPLAAWRHSARALDAHRQRLFRPPAS